MTKSKQIIVPVIVLKNSSGEYFIKGIKELKFNKEFDKIPADWNYDITFRVQNPHRVNYVFASDMEGFWIQDASLGCPQEYKHHPSFLYNGTSTDGLELYVTNLDPSHELLKYRLNLVDADGVRKPIDLDPIMNNQNSGFATREYSALAIAGAAVVGVVALIGIVALTGLLRSAADD